MPVVYSVNLLTTVAQADISLKMANDENSDLLFRKSALIRERDSAATTAQRISKAKSIHEAKLIGVNSTINSGTVTDPEYLDELTREKTIHENRLEELSQKQVVQGSYLVLKKEYEMAQIEVQLAEVANYISQVTARKQELS